jgi:hypothetical protein
MNRRHILKSLLAAPLALIGIKPKAEASNPELDRLDRISLDLMKSTERQLRWLNRHDLRLIGSLDVKPGYTVKTHQDHDGARTYVYDKDRCCVARLWEKNTAYDMRDGEWKVIE